MTGLAILPIDYLSRRGCPYEQACSVETIDSAYRGVFTTGIKAYQLVVYRQLVREHFGRDVANQIVACQNRLLEEHEDGGAMNKAVKLINTALDSDTVAADTDSGVVEIPIEMNVALSLLLGVDSSPHCVNHPDASIDEICTMEMDIDWKLSSYLMRAGNDMQDLFIPLFSCIDSGVPIDYAKAYINEKLIAH